MAGRASPASRCRWRGRICAARRQTPRWRARRCAGHARSWRTGASTARSMRSSTVPKLPAMDVLDERLRRQDGVLAQEAQGRTVLLRLDDGGYYALDDVG